MASANYYISGDNVEVWLSGLAIYDANGNEIKWTRRVNWTLYNISAGNSRQADYYVDISPGNTEGGYYTFQDIPDGTFQASARITNASTGAYVTTLSSEMFTVSNAVASPWTAYEDAGFDVITTYDQYVEIYDYGTGNYRLEEYTIHCYEVEFENSGYAHFYTVSDIDTIGYLSDSNRWKSDWSGPLSHLTTDDDSGDSSNFDIKYYVTAGVKYYIFVRGYSGEETGHVELCVTAPCTVAKWSWSASNGSASTQQTSDAHSAILNREDTRNFSHRVWNDLVDKVKEILEEKGLSWDTYYATHSGTKMTSEPYELTADKFNSLRNNLDFAYVTGISKVNSGDAVLGSYFTTLALCINSAIDTL